MDRSNLQIHPDVDAALTDGRPIVALESTIISHGLPYPANLETARELEDTIRSEGAIPATLAIVRGQPTIGVGNDDLERLARGEGVLKISRRDLPIAVASGADGATTVAATMILAAAAGIEVFATGGLGGVHRGAEETFDISADLQELARTNVAVVCAGAKAVLDLGRTLEYLETHGVPVIGYRSDAFPAFYTRDSGFAVDHRADQIEEIARIIRTKWDLGLSGGLVIANPIPEQHEMDPKLVEREIDDALAAADLQSVRGKDVTPFLLSRIERSTGGASLAANRALVLSNARLGARLAVALAAPEKTSP